MMIVFALVGIPFLFAEHIGDCFYNNLEVEQEGPVLDVFDVLLHASLHLVDVTCLTTETCHLSQTCNAGLCKVANRMVRFVLSISVSVSVVSRIL